MKLLISIAMIPAMFSLIISGLCAGFFRIASELPTVAESNATAHVLKGCLYASVGTGLSCCIFSVGLCSVLTILSFIFKSWTKAVENIAGAFLGGMLWCYFLDIPYPIG